LDINDKPHDAADLHIRQLWLEGEARDRARTVLNKLTYARVQQFLREYDGCPAAPKEPPKKHYNGCGCAECYAAFYFD
jgi:hypothetical protein